MNKAILIGNVGKDPEVLKKDTTIVKLSLATSETYKDKSGERKTVTEWHSIIMFGKLAEIAEKYVKKGDKLYIEGKIKYENYEKDGITKYFTQIIANNIEMLGQKRTDVDNKDNRDVETEQTNDLPF